MNSGKVARSKVKKEQEQPSCSTVKTELKPKNTCTGLKQKSNANKEIPKSKPRGRKRTASIAILSDTEQEEPSDDDVPLAEIAGEVTSVVSDVSDDEVSPELSASTASTANSIATHLDEKIKRKIVQGRYVALCTLLPSHRSTTKLSYSQSSNTLVASHTSRRLYNFSEWTDAFLIYASVRSEAHPLESPALFKYMQTIKRINDRRANFVRYDDAFRMKFKGLPTIPWGTVDSEELGWAVGDPSFIPYDKFKEQRTGARSRNFSFRRSVNSQTKSVDICYDFNNNGKCHRNTCKYLHKCQKCGANHSKKACTA